MGQGPQATEHDRPMEEEAAKIPHPGFNLEAAPAVKVGTAIRTLFEALRGVDLEIPERQPIREPPRFD